MNDWILLTPERVSDALSDAQKETIDSRPHQGTDHDPLAIAIAEAVTQVRSAVRANGFNRLSTDTAKIPHELRQCACLIAMQQLEQQWAPFVMSEPQKNLLTLAENTLKEVREGKSPVTLPSDPEPADTVRRTAGVSVLRERKQPLSARNLREL